MLTRETLLSGLVPAIHTVEIPGIGSVRIRELTMGEANELAGPLKGMDYQSNCYVLQRCLLNEAGAPLVNAEEMEAALQALSTATIKALISAILIKSGFSVAPPS